MDKESTYAPNQPISTDMTHLARAVPASASYSDFDSIDGGHPLQSVSPESCVLYKVRTRHGGRVAFLNFHLATEMGLLPKDHPHELNPALEQKILDTFAIQIINEYDVIHKVKIPEKDIRPKPRMATRYLQLQHPKKDGSTSGDGRSIWNGFFEGRGKKWDISSCGTGGTQLSPWIALGGDWIKTGDDESYYGSGEADMMDGFAAAMMSEIFHRKGIQTERTLAIIEFKNGVSINVRANENLFRPSHFFAPLRQTDQGRLRKLVDLYYNREKENGNWPALSTQRERDSFFLKHMATTFGQICADFESHYIFVWLDWDGDNILANGGIIDYGSVRQFGLFHHEYRFDDDGNWSTKLTEQRKKGRDTIQVFAQMMDFLEHGRKRPLSQFLKSEAVQTFEETLKERLLQNLLHRVGTEASTANHLFENETKLVESFLKTVRFLEMQKTKKKPHKLADGKTHDVIYNVPRLLRLLPGYLIEESQNPTPERIQELLLSSYAARSDRPLTPERKRNLIKVVKLYLKMAQKTAEFEGRTLRETLGRWMMKASVTNHPQPITGEAVIRISDLVFSERSKLTGQDFIEIVDAIVENQTVRPLERSLGLSEAATRKVKERFIEKAFQILQEFKETH